MGVRNWLREYDAEGPALMASPILLVPFYVYLTGVGWHWSVYSDIIVAIAAVAIGAAGVCLLPASRLLRVVLFPVYAAIILFGSALWAIAYRGGL